MSDFLNLISKENAPVAREVSIGGNVGTVYFRMISAGEREQILKGLKIEHKGGQDSIEIDLAGNERQKQMFVFYSVCDEEGNRYFKKIDEVRNLPAVTLEALSDHAQDVNSQKDAGKD